MPTVLATSPGIPDSAVFACRGLVLGFIAVPWGKTNTHLGQTGIRNQVLTW